MLRVFISYRREDSEKAAGALYQAFRQWLGARGMFRDVASIPSGTDFATVLQDTIRLCDVMFVLIGPHWLTAQDEQGQRRLGQAADFVHQEIALGLRSGALVIPVLLDDTPMPAAADLPPDIAPLVHRQGANWHGDQRSTQESAYLYRLARQFVRRTPRQPLVQNFPWTIPLVTIASYGYLLSQPHNELATLFVWLVYGILWLLPLLFAANWRLWQYFAPLAVPYLGYLFFGLNFLNTPNALNLTLFGVVLAFESLILLTFIQHIPRSPNLTIQPDIEAGTASMPTVAAMPAMPWYRRALPWVVAVLAILCILAAVIGGGLFYGRDLNSNDPALQLSYNSELVATYLGAGALVVAVLILILDTSQTYNRSRRSSPWGDFSSSRREGLKLSAYALRSILMFAPLALYIAFRPTLIALSDTPANQLALNLSIRSIAFAVSALLSLIRLPVRQ